MQVPAKIDAPPYSLYSTTDYHIFRALEAYPRRQEYNEEQVENAFQ